MLEHISQAFAAPLGPGQEGWLGVLRNPVYRPNVYRIVGGSKAPEKRAQQLNDVASVRPTGIGYWQVVGHVATASPQVAFETLKRELRPYVMESGTNFYEAPLEILISVLDDVANCFTAAQSSPVSGPAASPPTHLQDKQRPTPLISAVSQGAAQVHEADSGAIGPDEVFRIAVLTGVAHPSYAPWTFSCGRCCVGLRLFARPGDVGVVRYPDVDTRRGIAKAHPVRWQLVANQPPKLVDTLSQFTS